MTYLICNAGSSSLKFSLFEAGAECLLAEGGIDWAAKPARLVLKRPGQADVRKELGLQKHADAMSGIVAELQSGANAPLKNLNEMQAVGHRIVHGGDHYAAAVRITPEVERTLDELSELAPLHNPPSLEVIRAVKQILPDVPQVAAFDTAFHATLSESARTYPVPRSWTRDWAVRRYGFHGLSHSYCARRAAEMIGRKNFRLIIAHLGNGASMSAVRNGVCVDTSMGFTPMEGLMMGTRSGTIDPGLQIYLLRQKGFDVEKLDHALNYESGLLGVSGVSSDLRQVMAAASENSDARLAIDVYVHRIRQTIGAMAATLGGVDALVFTAGVGENSVEIREQVCDNLDFLGVKLDRAANRNGRPDVDVARSDSAARILVIATREDLTILREMRGLIER